MTPARPIRLLVVAYYFPPISTSGALRPRAFVRHLAARGWDTHVIAADAASVVPRLEVDADLCADLPAAVRVDRVAHRNLLYTIGALRAAVRRWAYAGASNGGAAAAGVARGSEHSKIAAAKELIFERLLAFPDQQRDWYRAAVRRGKRLTAGWRPDVVFATGGPWTALLVGRRLAAHYGVPFVADFRDPWTRNPYRRTRLDAQAVALERAVVESATCIVANTAELQRQFCSDYPHLARRFVTIPNGFENPADSTPPVMVSKKGPLRLCHFGTVYGQRSPRRLLGAMQAALASGIDPSRLRVRFVGRWEVDDVAVNDLAGRLEQQGVLERVPPLPYAECQRQMRSAEALLVLQPGSPLQIPGKVYEYIASGRPLLVVGGDGATAALVRGSRLGLCCADDERELGEVLTSLGAGTLRLVPPARDDVTAFEYGRLASRLAEVLERVTSERSPS